jgi:hypothetical protein
MAMIPYAFAGREFEPEGGFLGIGTWFREMCPPGQYLVGLRYRSSFWIDEISMICAPVDTTGLTGPRWYGSTFPRRGLLGPTAPEQSCFPGHIISSASLNTNITGVHSIEFVCRPTTRTSGGHILYVGSSGGVTTRIAQSEKQ